PPPPTRPPPPTTPPSPYTTLFRSGRANGQLARSSVRPLPTASPTRLRSASTSNGFCRSGIAGSGDRSITALIRITLGCPLPFDRSEEHTSELQSRFDLVCRPLLDN